MNYIQHHQQKQQQTKLTKNMLLFIGMLVLLFGCYKTDPVVGFSIKSNTNKYYINQLSSHIKNPNIQFRTTVPDQHGRKRIVQQLQQQQRQVFSVLHMSSSKEDEIYKLEEQIRQLRLEQLEQKNKNDKVSLAETNALSIEMERKLELIKGKDMILSEQELITGGIVDLKEDVRQSSSIVTTIVGLIVLVGVVVGFAQVPIGQDGLAQYSATGSSTTTLKQIDLGDLNPSKYSSSSSSSTQQN